MACNSTLVALSVCPPQNVGYNSYPNLLQFSTHSQKNSPILNINECHMDKICHSFSMLISWHVIWVFCLDRVDFFNDIFFYCYQTRFLIALNFLCSFAACVLQTVIYAIFFYFQFFFIFYWIVIWITLNTYLVHKIKI